MGSAPPILSLGSAFGVCARLKSGRSEFDPLGGHLAREREVPEAPVRMSTGRSGSFSPVSGAVWHGTFLPSRQQRVRFPSLTLGRKAPRLLG